MAYPDEATSPSAGIILLLPRVAEGRSVDPNWDVLGMRATRSDSLILDECLAAGKRRGLSLGRHAAVPPRQSELVLGLVHAGLSRRRAGGLRRDAAGRRTRASRKAMPSRSPIIPMCAATSPR